MKNILFIISAIVALINAPLFLQSALVTKAHADTNPFHHFETGHGFISLFKDSPYGRMRPCSHPSITVLPKHDIWTPLMMQEDQATPSFGVWTSHLNVESCGLTFHLNVLSVATNTQNIISTMLFPGNTLIPPDFQHAAWGTFLDSANPSLITHHCPNAFLRDSSVNTMPTTPKDSWEENWTIGNCSNTFTVKVIITPENTSAGITKYNVKSLNTDIIIDNPDEPDEPRGE